jgi:lactose/L-arabinose transport system ATP-binding protein
VRPEHFGEAGQGDADIEVNVDVIEQLGATSYAYAGVSGEELVIERDPKLAAGRGGSLTVSVAATTCYAFDAAGNRLR